jgi:hypothetical protein
MLVEFQVLQDHLFTGSLADLTMPVKVVLEGTLAQDVPTELKSVLKHHLARAAAEDVAVAVVTEGEEAVAVVGAAGDQVVQLWQQYWRLRRCWRPRWN